MQSNVVWSFLPNTILRYSSRYARRNRKVAITTLPKQVRKAKQNPGIEGRIGLLYNKQEINENIQEDDFEDLETDFMSVGKVHRVHKDEVELFKEKQKLLIVGRKYFKDNNVNFLTWNDKEQIRHLHHTNPEEWTIEKLSEGFPAFPNTIAKIINASWKPRSESRKNNHDKQVENNWKLLEKGKLNDLPSELIEHVMKFSRRKLNVNRFEEKIIIKNTTADKPPGEFGSIIENYNKLVNEKNKKMKENVRQDEDVEDSKYNRNKKIVESQESNKKKEDRRMITLHELKKDIEKNMDKNKNVDEYEKMIVKEVVKEEKPIEEKSLTLDTVKIGSMQTYKVELNKVANVDKKVFDALRYPERITIPKEKFKKGSTYKVNDCYYDDDGEFLYRVPGIY